MTPGDRSLLTNVCTGDKRTVLMNNKETVAVAKVGLWRWSYHPPNQSSFLEVYSVSRLLQVCRLFSSF